MRFGRLFGGFQSGPEVSLPGTDQKDRGPATSDEIDKMAVISSWLTHVCSTEIGGV